MNRWTRLAGALAIGAGLAAAGMALAQSQTGNAAPPAASAQTAPPPAATPQPAAQPAPPWDPSGTPAFKFPDRDVSQHTYSVDPPPDGPSGVYLPAVILGYGKSVAGCIVVGCDDGPQVNGAPASSSGAAEPPPASPPSPEPPH